MPPDARSGARHAAIDRPLRRGRLNDSTLAGAASVAGPAYHLNAQLGRNQVEHLGAIVTDHMQHTATAGAFLALDVDDDLVAWQVCGQCTAIAIGCRGAPPFFPLVSLQSSRIVRQSREIDLHNAMMMTHLVASRPMTPA
jgi:hypothetical protein